ncbi:hypothetical protein OX284_009705 [Flavobacterium sp. SUN046]|uniref:hypothetical protein n=1 Tax=Flavobacterium sp. SUN046 TaxID=3002440 RepID=UPI002DBCC6A1|nr:hypothetical protein [Flavobacterium sp. SUN046]MEC4049700.1 hypothetical protein [Flavobacterium sp. SUN046]
MNPEFYNRIISIKAHRQSRDDNKDFVIAHPSILKELIQLALNTKDKNHHKAWWVLELIAEEQIELLLPDIDLMCNNIQKICSDQAVRPASRVCMFLAQSKKITLSPIQEEKLIERCLDWLIQPERVAAKAYSMRALYSLGKKHPWIHEELRMILSQDYKGNSPAYIAAAKDILRRLK